MFLQNRALLRARFYYDNNLPFKQVLMEIFSTVASCF